MEKKQLEHRRDLLEGLFTRNSVLICGLALPMMIAAATSLKNAVALSIGMFVVSLPPMILSSLVGQRLPYHLRMLVYTLLAGVMLIPARELLLAMPLDNTIISSMGIYFPLIAVNTIMYVRGEQFAISNPPHYVFVDAVCHLLGFALVAAAGGAIREFLGNGTLWGISMNYPFKARGFLVVFGGFIVTAFLAAGARYLIATMRRIRTAYRAASTQWNTAKE